MQPVLPDSAGVVYSDDTNAASAAETAPADVVVVPADIVHRCRSWGANGVVPFRMALWFLVEAQRVGRRALTVSAERFARELPDVRGCKSARTLERHWHRWCELAEPVDGAKRGVYRLKRGEDRQVFVLRSSVVETLLGATAKAVRVALGLLPRGAYEQSRGAAGMVVASRRFAAQNHQGRSRAIAGMRELRAAGILEDNRPGSKAAKRRAGLERDIGGRVVKVYPSRVVSLPRSRLFPVRAVVPAGARRFLPNKSETVKAGPEQATPLINPASVSGAPACACAEVVAERPTAPTLTASSPRPDERPLESVPPATRLTVSRALPLLAASLGQAVERPGKRARSHIAALVAACGTVGTLASFLRLEGAVVEAGRSGRIPFPLGYLRKVACGEHRDAAGEPVDFVAAVRSGQYVPSDGGRFWAYGERWTAEPDRRAAVMRRQAVAALTPTGDDARDRGRAQVAAEVAAALRDPMLSAVADAALERLDPRAVAERRGDVAALRVRLERPAPTPSASAPSDASSRAAREVGGELAAAARALRARLGARR